MVIELSDKLVSAVKLHAKKRHDSKDKSFRNARRFHSGDEYEPHTVGLFGEVAYAKLKGLKVNTVIYPVRDGGEDFKNIEVKTLTYFGPGQPELKIPLKEYNKRKPPLLYVLCRVDMKKPNRVEVLGEITRKDFDKKKVQKKYGDGHHPINYIVPLSQMILI
jgi:hypothetical protein